MVASQFRPFSVEAEGEIGGQECPGDGPDLAEAIVPAGSIFQGEGALREMGGHIVEEPGDQQPGEETRPGTQHGLYGAEGAVAGFGEEHHLQGLVADGNQAGEEEVDDGIGDGAWCRGAIGSRRAGR